MLWTRSSLSAMNHIWAVFLCVYIYVSMQYCHLNTSLFIVYLNHIFIIIIFFLFLFFLLRRVLTLILKLSTLSSSSSSFYSFYFILFLFLPTRHYLLFHHYSGSQCCYYCFMCSLLACRLAGTDCKNRQLPKILILE